MMALLRFQGAPDGGSDWKAGTYPIAPGTGTGETCCTTFWIKFNQRFQSIAPSNETYVTAVHSTSVVFVFFGGGWCVILKFRLPPVRTPSACGLTAWCWLVCVFI